MQVGGRWDGGQRAVISRPMKNTPRRDFLTAACLLGAGKAFPRSIPDAIRPPVKVVLPYPYTISIAREVPARMLGRVGLDHYFENKYGAGGKIATQYMKNQGGNDTLMVSSNTITVSNFLGSDPDLGSDYRKFFRCIGMISRTPFVMVVRGDERLDLLGYLQKIRAHADKINYSISSNMDLPHVCGTLLSGVLRATLTAVPYKSNHVVPLLSGEVDFTFLPVSSALPYLKGAELKILALTSPAAEALPGLEGYPSLTRYPGFESIEVVTGLVASAAMDNRVCSFYTDALNAVLQDEDYRGIQARSGIFLYRPNGPDRYHELIIRESEKLKKILSTHTDT